MIHAYNEQFLDIIQNKLAVMFELAVLKERLDVDDFANRFAMSKAAKALEKADPVYALGKSANELLALVISRDPLDVEITCDASPEYWLGWVLAYAQWYFNTSYSSIIKALPCSKLICHYFPYHEMDIMHSMDLIGSHLDLEPALRRIRRAKGWSQADLARLSGVSLRAVKAYEQGSLDISKAQVETVYRLSDTLGCTIEELIGIPYARRSDRIEALS